MRLFRVVAFMLLVAGTCFGQEWIEYVNRADRFVVNLPGQPTMKDTTFKSEYDATLPAHVYTAQAGPVHYSVTVVNYKDADVLDLRGAVDWAAWQIRKRGGEITIDAFAQNDRIEGHQLHIVNANKTRTLAQIHQYDRRLYILEATAPVDYPPPIDFQQSLVILDADGVRVRFDLDKDGNRAKRVPGESYVAGAD
jgi:hypothetical protein